MTEKQLPLIFSAADAIETHLDDYSLKAPDSYNDNLDEGDNGMKDENRNSMYQDIKDLHEKFNLLRSDTPGHVSGRKLLERADFLQEEVDEFRHACSEQDLGAQAHELVDIAMVAIGTAIMLGVPWEKIWDNVHECNMNKERGSDSRGLVGLVKPEDWVGPNPTTILMENGYTSDNKFDVVNYRDDEEYKNATE